MTFRDRQVETNEIYSRYDLHLHIIGRDVHRYRKIGGLQELKRER